MTATTLADRRDSVFVWCPMCGWHITLTVGGVLVWTDNGQYQPRCLRPLCVQRPVLEMRRIES